MKNNIIKEFKKLKKEICPRSEWVSGQRVLLLQQINPQNEYKLAPVGLNGYTQVVGQIFHQYLLEPAVIMLLVLGVFLGSSLTINAAFYSLPGEPLYKVKIVLEKAHLALISDEGKKVEMKIEFAQNRVEEFDKIVQQTSVSPAAKKQKIEAAVKEFKNNVVALNSQLNKIKITNNQIPPAEKEKTLKMALTVSSKTEKLARSFDEKIKDLSEVEKLEVKELVAEAIQSAEATSQSAQALVQDATTASEGSGVIKGAETTEEADTANQQSATSTEQNESAAPKD